MVVDWVCHIFVTVNGIAYGEVYGLGFCEETFLEVWQGKMRMAGASDQTKFSALAILNV